MKDKKGQPVPGKVSFIGLTPTHSPYFLPDNPVVSGQSSEGFKNLVYPPKDCLEVSLSAGTSLAVSSHGPEDTMELRVVEVLGAQKAELSFTIDKSVDTRRLVSVDSHIHTQNSNGYVGIAERLHSVMAEGVGVAVKANHNFITDYRPELERVGLASDLVVISGYEVTARTGSVHFIILPAAVRPGGRTQQRRDQRPERNPGDALYISPRQESGLSRLYKPSTVEGPWLFPS